MWLVLLAACGGGGGGGGGGGPVTSNGQLATARTGQVYGPPLVTTPVYRDHNGNGKVDPGETPIGEYTDDQGRFGRFGPFTANTPLLAHTDADTVYQIDHHSRLPEFLRAPAGATVVSAITDILARRLLSTEQMKRCLPEAFDPLHDSPYGDFAKDPTTSAADIAKIKTINRGLLDLIARHERDEATLGAEVSGFLRTLPDKSPSSVAVHEHHPHTKPIFDLDGIGLFSMVRTEEAPDNRYFRVDEQTGEIWFLPSQGYLQPDFEQRVDQGQDSRFDLAFLLTAPDGTTRRISLQVEVRDIEHEPGVTDHVTFSYYRPELRDDVFGILDKWFSTYRDGLSEQETKARKNYVKWLLDGIAWASSTTNEKLQITWSLEFGEYLTDQDRFDEFRFKIEQALAQFEAFLNIDFVEVIHFEGLRSHIDFSVFPDSREDSSADTRPYGGAVRLENTASEATIIHEIAHALGLTHPFERTDNHPGNYLPSNPSERNNQSGPSQSVMTYHKPGIERTLTHNDMNALSFLFGGADDDWRGLYTELLRHYEDFSDPGGPEWL